MLAFYACGAFFRANTTVFPFCHFDQSVVFSLALAQNRGFCAIEERQRSEVARRVYAACLERSLPKRGKLLCEPITGMRQRPSAECDVAKRCLRSTRAKPWLLRDRGAATKRSCKARLRSLLKAQFAATSAWRNPGAQRRTKGSVPLHHAPRNCRSVFRMSVRGQPINFNHFHRSAQFI